MDNLQVYIINLDRSTDRWERWKDIDMGFPKSNIHRFSAVDGKKIDDNTLKQYITPLGYLKILGGVKRSSEDIDNKGAVCCSLSHFGVWDDFLEKHPDSQYLLVFEDDTKLSNDHKKNLLNILKNHHKEFPDDKWDVWILGSVKIRETYDWNNPPDTPKASDLLRNPLNTKNSSSRFRDVRSFWGSNAYIIKKDAIPKVSKYKFPIDTHIDIYLGILAQNGYIRIINDKKLNLSQGGFNGTIAHNQFSIALLNQNDFIYKIIVILLMILVLGLIYIYIFKGCFGYNIFYFLGNNLECKK